MMQYTYKKYVYAIYIYIKNVLATNDLTTVLLRTTLTRTIKLHYYNFPTPKISKKCDEPHSSNSVENATPL